MQRSWWMRVVVLALASAWWSGYCAAADAPPASQEEFKIVEVKKIWDQAPHNAFTDLIRFQGALYLTFREGSKHVSDDGKVRIIRSTDGEHWESVALFSSEDQDMRECKFSITPDGRLMLTGAAHNLTPGKPGHNSYVWFSSDGRNWSERTQIADPAVWMWRIAWHDGTAYGFGYSTDPNHPFVRLYSSTDGKEWKTVAPAIFTEGFPNETSPVFVDDGTLLLLLRRDQGTTTAQLGRSQPPYTQWMWKDLGQRIGGPNLLVLPDGRLLAPIRLLNPMRTSLCWIDPDGSKITEFLKLPSGGDGGYPGAVLEDGILWVSYYSSHENHKSSVYLAKIQVKLSDSPKAGGSAQSRANP